ncbi:EAL domain-containing protein [Acholeplasma sp. OttesenSCG-928-E16]|nr:EAL domain-containing protein [Acholeplasma sp. OttesenSCG-928-E16]
MKNISKRTTIVLVAFITVISIGLAFLYFYVSNNYFNSKAGEQLGNVNTTLSLNIDVNVENDHALLEKKVTDILNAGDDIRVIINQSPELFSLGNSTLVSSGTINSEGNYVSISDYVYYFREGQREFKLLFSSSVAIYSMDEAFSNASNVANKDDKLIVFRTKDGYCFMYNANNYFSNILKANEEGLNYTFYLADSLTNLYYSNNETKKEYIDAYMSDSYERSELQSELSNLDFRDKVSILNFNGTRSFVARRVIDSKLFVDNRISDDPSSAYSHNYTMMLFTVYNYADVRTDVNFLAFILIVIFIVVVASNAALVFYVLHMVKKKTSSAEGAKNSYLRQLKTYSMEIVGNGNLKNFNDVFKQEFIDFEKYKNIKDLKIMSDLGPDIVLSRKESFVGAFVKGGQEFYIKFEFVKTVLRTVLVGLDVTSLVSSLEESQRLAFRNQVSGLPNKNSLMKSLKELFAQQGFLDKNNSLVAINIAKFRYVNQIVGTRIADTIIVDIGNEISESLARHGFNFQVFNTIADNFICLLENIKNYDDVVRWVDTFLDERKKKKTGNSILDIELKIGVFHLARNEEYSVLTVDTAYESVMEALNAAKDLSTNRAIFDSRLGQVSSRRKMMEMDLIEAIKKEEFIMYLQPQYSASKQKIIGFEALLRWDNPKYINESPARYIEIAESNGMIIDIGKIIIKKTFQLARELAEYGVCISMNVSPVQILQAGFATEIVEEYKKNNLKPGQISVEITETFLITSFELIINKVKILKEQGISIHLDDFGTGYSSLLYLKELPINTIKIDRGFVTHLENDKYSKSIVSMICNLGKNLGFDIIAEGVERQTQVNLLSKYGADIIQGYFISKPVPKAQAIELLEKYNGGKAKISATNTD